MSVPDVFSDPQAMAEVAQLFRRALARCGPDCDHSQPEAKARSKAAS